MTIKIGDCIPSVTLKHMGDGGMQEITTDSLFGGRKVVMFGVPGAFTPTCSNQHVPGFVRHAGEIKKKGVDSIVCLSVNDPFVMKEWGQHQGVADKVVMLPDGNGELTNKMGLALDVSAAGLGMRCKRFAMVVEDGVVKSLRVEDSPSALEVSGAEEILKAL
jgi:peroxiredoxin